jgi:hypothetical protein
MPRRVATKRVCGTDGGATPWAYIAAVHVSATEVWRLATRARHGAPVMFGVDGRIASPART